MPFEAFGKGIPSMHATTIVQAAMQAWEEHDANALASYLSDDVICKQILPQSIGKAQLLAFMKAITTAFSDWSFNGHVLLEKSLAEHSWRVLFVTAVTDTQAADLILATTACHPCHRHKDSPTVQAPGIPCDRRCNHGDHRRFLAQRPGGSPRAVGTGTPVG